MSESYYSGSLAPSAVKTIIRPGLNYRISVNGRTCEVPYNQVIPTIRAEGWEGKKGKLEVKSSSGVK